MTPEKGGGTFLVANYGSPCYANAVESRIRDSVAAVRSQKRAMGLRPSETWFTTKQLQQLDELAKRIDVPRELVIRQLVDEALERRVMENANQLET